MQDETLGAAFEREHREIDQGIEAFTAGPAADLDQVAPLIRAMDALRRHIYLEEQFLFPPLKQAGLMAPIFVMLREHGQLWQSMDTVTAALEQGDRAATLDACHTLTAQLERHNSKEEPILYPQADTVLSAAAGDELRVLLESGRLPAGWVCQGARP